MTFGERSVITLDWVAIKEEEVRGLLFCVQDFVRNPHFTERFFSESGVTLLSEAAAIADSNTGSCVFAPWSQIESQSSGQVVADLKTCLEKVPD